MKYVIVLSHGIECAIIFNELLTHSDVAYTAGKPISAGFVVIDTNTNTNGRPKSMVIEDGDIYCYGESVSLGLKSRPEEDTKIIKKQIFGV